ncbi:anthrone oxygenase family protein [Pedobacter sp.]|uniref:anthrone oxygenase family protein n=1 Tax=Pedobacter sp. TaxID=1411316 RepID=UPI003BA97008
MKKIILLSSVTVASGVLFANIFNSMVIAVATDSDIPNSVLAAREFFKTANPGNFFKIFSPASQFLTLLSLILCWKKAKHIRLFLGIALICYISGDIFAFTYFHPRTDIMMSTPTPDTETLKRLSSEWSSMNWVRSFILLIGVVFSFAAVDRFYSLKSSAIR